MKRHYFLTLLLALLTHVSMYATQRLTINGEVVEKTVAQITFDGDNVVLHFTDATTETTDMDGVALEMTVVTGIDMTDNTFSLKGLVDGELNISGLEAGQVSVYDASGRLVTGARVAGSDTRIDVSSLQRGIYILKAGNQIVKFMKR